MFEFQLYLLDIVSPSTLSDVIFFLNRVCRWTFFEDVIKVRKYSILYGWSTILKFG